MRTAPAGAIEIIVDDVPAAPIPSAASTPTATAAIPSATPVTAAITPVASAITPVAAAGTIPVSTARSVDNKVIIGVIVNGVVSIPRVANAVPIAGSVANTGPIIRIPRRKFVIRPGTVPVASQSRPISNLTWQRSRTAITEAWSVVVSQSATRTVDVPQSTSRSISDLTWQSSRATITEARTVDVSQATTRAISDLTGKSGRTTVPRSKTINTTQSTARAISDLSGQRGRSVNISETSTRGIPDLPW